MRQETGVQKLGEPRPNGRGNRKPAFAKASAGRQEAAREISAGLVIFRRTEEGPKFLLLYHGGRYWNFPKGKIEAEEKSLEAAMRETGEETGLREAELRLKKKFRAYERYGFFRNKKRIFKIVIFYLAETRVRQIKLSKEHEGFGWFLYRDARNLLRAYKDSETVLRRAYTFLRRSERQITSTKHQLSKF